MGLNKPGMPGQIMAAKDSVERVFIRATITIDHLLCSPVTNLKWDLFYGVSLFRVECFYVSPPRFRSGCHLTIPLAYFSHSRRNTEKKIGRKNRFGTGLNSS